MEILAVKDLSFTYPMCERPCVNHVRFTVDSGEFVVLCGATGSGKSTLLRRFKREIAPSGSEIGEITFLANPLQRSRPRRSVLWHSAPMSRS